MKDLPTTTTVDTTVFIVDDDASVRKGLTRLVRATGWNTETFSSASKFLARSSFSGTGCVVLDVRMPGMTGPELRDQMAARKISLPIVFLTGHSDVPMGVEAMKKGAVDFLVKPVDGEAFLRAIRLALQRHAIERTQAGQHRAIEERLAQLSPREREVMEYVIAGCLNKQIAVELGIAEKTVKVHRGRIMQKMEITSVAELVRLCGAFGIQPRQPFTRRTRPGRC